MVQAILEGRKTQTRRTKGITRIEGVNGMKTMTFPKDGHKETFVDASFTTFDIKVNSGLISCPYGAIGDVLWVRETFACDVYFNGITEGCFTYFKADYNGPVDWNWKPSIHMPKVAARIWLEITDIRVERLQEISESDALEEGVESKDGKGEWFRDYMEPRSWFHTPKPSFFSLWRRINGTDSLRANPWVWVISFKVISTTGRPAELGKEVAHA